MTVQVIVFDLDGTLYQDTHHFDYYAKRLCEKLPIKKHDAFWQDYETVLTGRHTLQMGTVYDVQQDTILLHQNGIVTEGFSWTGEKLAQETIAQLYGITPLQFNFHTMLNVGDLWWVPSSIARHYGLSAENAHVAFKETRDFMMTEAYHMKPVTGFQSFMKKLSKKKKLVLMTNSPKEDSDVILKKLGIEDVFISKFYQAKKPIETTTHFQAIHRKCDVSFHEILSIGDNYINEIAPARALGCQTILIDPHHLYPESVADAKVTSIQEYMELLSSQIE